MNTGEPVKVYDAWNSPQAHFLCQLLANADISARVASDAIEIVSGAVPFQKASCQVWVQAPDAEQAQSILADYDEQLQHHDRTETVPDEPYCYHCGHTVQLRQSPCPKCGCELEWSDETDA